MNFKLSFSLVLIVTFIHSFLFSQDAYYPQPEFPELFKAIPLVDENTPEWAQVMYAECLNFVKIENLKNEYFSVHLFEKSIHTQNYKHWLKAVQNYTNDAGMVDLPKAGQVFMAHEKKKQLQETDSKSMPNTWSNIGPNVTYNNGNLNTRPTQANVYCLGVSPSNTSVVYAGMETGGIFKSIDKGLNWFPVSSDYAIGAPREIKVDPLDENIVYVVVNSELYKSSNGGSSWSLVYTSPSTIEQLFIHSSVTDTVYAATQSGVLRSNDGGVNWSALFSGYVYDIEAKPGTNETLYISVKNDVAVRPEVFKSTNSGASWNLMDNGFYSPTDLSVATVYGCKIGVTPADPNRLYAGIIATGKEGDNGWIGVYYSLDEGATWQEDSGFDGGPYASGNDVNTNWYVGGYSSGYHQGWYNFDLDVSHTNADRLWIGTIWFCESGNKGGNIEYIRGTRSLSMHADIQDIDVVGNEIWVASDGGINYSEDEFQTTDVRMNGITASDFWGFGQGWNEDTWVGGRYHNGNAAFHENYGVGNTVMLGGAESPTGYVNPFDSRKTHFTDIGDKKLSTSLSVPSENIPNLGMYPTQSYFHFNYSEVEWHPNFANQLYVGSGTGFFKSMDGGANFTQLYAFPGEIRRFEICKTNPNLIYAIVYHSYWDWRVYKSENGGSSFGEITAAPFSSGSWRNLSLAINPYDGQEIWIASNSSDNGNKIFRSTDGGTSWTNKYSSNIIDEAIKDLVFHGSPDGDMLYVMTNDNFFYHDIETNIWTQYNDGLPVQHKGFMILPFYRDEKMRMASAKGIWEIDFVRSNKVLASPIVEMDSVFCSRDTVQFESFSIVNGVGVQWDWSFSPTPQYISNANARNPKVVFDENGAYDVTLSVTDANGNSNSNTVIAMVHVQNECQADTIPGDCLSTIDNGDYAVASNVNLTNVTHFTMTGWWKPNGAQQGFAAIASSGDWCAHCDNTEGLIVSYFGDKLWYKWPGNAANWGSNSGITIPLDEWSYVALTIEPTKATMYLNDQKYVHNIPLSPGNIEHLYLGYGHYSKSFKGDIDEVTIWKRTLSEDEIRKLRHLTKEDQIEFDTSLVAYYQFNKLVNTTTIMDKAGSNHATLQANASTTISNVPVGGGVSEIYTVNGPMDIESITGMNLTFGNTGTYPNGDIVLSRIHLSPDVIPAKAPVAKSYWILNNYGTNSTFSSLQSLSFEDIGIIFSSSVPSNFNLSQRSENGVGSSWIDKGVANSLMLNDESVAYDVGLSVNSSGQYLIGNKQAIGWIGLVNNDWYHSGNWGGGTVPNSTDQVIIPPRTPYQPRIEQNVFIKGLILQPQAKMDILTGTLFETKE